MEVRKMKIIMKFHHMAGMKPKKDLNTELKAKTKNKTRNVFVEV